MNDLQSTFLILSASFSSTSCCFSSGNFWDNFKNRCFLAWGFVFVLLCSFTKKKTGSVFPAFCHTTFHHALITCCNVSRVGYNCSNVSRWGYIWFYARSCDQESGNDSPCIVEWKSRNITNDDIIGRYWTIIPQARMGSDSEAIKARGIIVSVKSSYLVKNIETKQL